MPKQADPTAAELDQRIAAVTPERVAQAIFAAVTPPDPRKQRREVGKPGTGSGPRPAAGSQPEA